MSEETQTSTVNVNTQTLSAPLAFTLVFTVRVNMTWVKYRPCVMRSQESCCTISCDTVTSVRRADTLREIDAHLSREGTSRRELPQSARNGSAHQPLPYRFSWTYGT